MPVLLQMRHKNHIDKIRKVLAFVMHRNLVNFTYPQDKQFSPMLLRGLNLFADRFTRTSVLRVMSHAFWSWYIECLTGLKPNTEIL